MTIIQSGLLDINTKNNIMYSPNVIGYHIFDPMEKEEILPIFHRRNFIQIDEKNIFDFPYIKDKTFYEIHDEIKNKINTNTCCIRLLHHDKILQVSLDILLQNLIDNIQNQERNETVILINGLNQPFYYNIEFYLADHLKIVYIDDFYL